MQITPDMTIASVVDRWPDSARIFARYTLGCASCAISKSETIAQAAAGHGAGRVKLDDLINELNVFADTGKLPEGAPPAPSLAAKGVPRGMAEQKGIKHVIAVMSGKGGVGKSLVAGLLAVGLKRRGFRRRCAGRRHHRPLDPADVRCPREADVGGRQDARSSEVARRHPDHVDEPHPPERRGSRHLARTDGLGSDPTILQRRAVGRARLPHRRSPAWHE
jgi:hybrid cluster-associated redox disulfide protein